MKNVFMFYSRIVFIISLVTFYNQLWIVHGKTSGVFQNIEWAVGIVFSKDWDYKLSIES